MKSVPMIRPKYIFLAGWFLTSIFILLNCHYDWNILDGTVPLEQFHWNSSIGTGVVSFEDTKKPLRKIIMIVTFMRSGSSFLGEFFNLHPGKFMSQKLTLKLFFKIAFTSLNRCERLRTTLLEIISTMYTVMVMLLQVS